MISEKSTREEKEVLFLVIISQVMIALILLLNLEYFPIDNPSVLLMSQGDFFDYIFISNIRLDFMYNIVCWISFYFFGSTPQVIFIIQWIFFELVYAIIYKLCSRFTQNFKAKIFIVFMGMIATSVAEQLFTIGKKEIFLMLGIASVMWFTYKFFYVEMSKYSMGISLFLLGISILFSLTLKETSKVLLVWFLLVVVYNWVWQPNNRKKIWPYSAVIVCVLLIVEIYKKIYIVSSAYTNVNLQFSTIIHNIAYYVRYDFDIIAMGIIGAISGIRGWIGERKNYNRQFCFLINICGWGYFCGMTLWKWPFSYYLYPCAVMFAMSLIGFVAYTTNRIKKIIICILLLISVYSIDYNYKVAISHIDLGRVYTDSINRINEVIKIEPGRVLVEDNNFYEEQPKQMSILLNGYLGNSIEVIGIKQWLYDVPMDESTLTLYESNMDEVKEYTEDFEPQIGDYVIKYVNVRNFNGSVRGVNPVNSPSYTSELENKWYDLELVNKSENNRKCIGADRRGIHIYPMQYGYALYRIVDRSYNIAGIDIDGWTGKELEIQNYECGLNFVIVIHDSSSVYLNLPYTEIEIWINNQFEEMIRVKPGDRLLLDEMLENYNVTDAIDLRFIVTDTFSPNSILGNKDTRELGINVTVEGEGDETNERGT